MRRVNNPQLPTIKQGYPGNKVVQGRFMNEYEGPRKTSAREVIRWMFTNKEHRALLRAHGNEQLRVHPLKRLPPKSKDSITWLGHASFLVTISGERFLIDPHLTSFFPIKRYAQAPITPEGLGTIDYTLISHGHRDHLDKKTIKRLRTKKILVPLGAKKLVERWNKQAVVEAAGWWQQYTTSEHVKAYFLPAYHWHARGFFDKNKMLWGSLIIQANGKSVYYAADTGYSDHFKDISKQFGKIDACIMPTTLYKPDDIMAADHMPIKDSIKAFDILKGELFIPMHYATLKIGGAGVGSTKYETERLFNQRKRKTGALRFMDVGETTYF